MDIYNIIQPSADWVLFMPNCYTWTEISSKGKQAAGYANTQINHVSLNCMDGNLYHWQILLSINYFDEQWSESMMPRVTFHSSKEMESIGPACLRLVVLHWRQFCFPRGHLAMFLSCHNSRGWKGCCYWNLVDAAKHSTKHRTPHPSPHSRELFGSKCQ